MIPAKRSRWFSELFARHARSRIAATFGRVLVSGLDPIRAACARGPVLVVANHTSWWDPLVALWLTQLVLQVEPYAMMDATNLRRLPFFGKVGAFGVDLDDPRDGVRAVRYAARTLDAPRRVLWIFPEGRERSPFDPLELRPGAALVERIARGAEVVSLGVRYVFAGSERPELWISASAPEPTRRVVDEALARQRDGIATELARIDASLSARSTAGFDLLVDRRPGLLATLAERTLSLLVRLF